MSLALDNGNDQFVVQHPIRWILACDPGDSFPCVHWAAVTFDRPVGGHPERGQLRAGTRWCFLQDARRARGDGPAMTTV